MDTVAIVAKLAKMRKQIEDAWTAVSHNYAVHEHATILTLVVITAASLNSHFMAKVSKNIILKYCTKPILHKLNTIKPHLAEHAETNG